MSYAPSTFQNWVKNNISLISDNDKKLMIREINEAAEHNMLGDECIDKVG